MAEKKVIVRQTRSAARRHRSQVATLQALGLGRIGRAVEHKLTPSVRGMVKSVSHLVVIEQAE